MPAMDQRLLVGQEGTLGSGVSVKNLQFCQKITPWLSQKVRVYADKSE
jgi:hypothetical protein